MNLQPFAYNNRSPLDKKEGKTRNLKFRTRSTRTFRGTKIKAGLSSGRRLSRRMFISRFPPDVHKWHSMVFNNPSVPIGNWSSPFLSFISPHTFPLVIDARAYGSWNQVLDSDSRDRSLERLVCPYIPENRGEKKNKLPRERGNLLSLPRIDERRREEGRYRIMLVVPLYFVLILGFTSSARYARTERLKGENEEKGR